MSYIDNSNIISPTIQVGAGGTNNSLTFHPKYIGEKNNVISTYYDNDYLFNCIDIYWNKINPRLNNKNSNWTNSNTNSNTIETTSQLLDFIQQARKYPTTVGVSLNNFVDNTTLSKTLNKYETLRNNLRELYNKVKMFDEAKNDNSELAKLIV